MAGGNMKLMLTLAAKEAGASSALKQMEQNIKRTAQSAIQESQKAGRAQEGVIRKIEREQRQASAARARLGIRSEQDIRREMVRTQQAYTALARSGKASQNDLQRAARATKQRVRELNEELGKSSKIQKTIQIGGAVMAGTTAGAAVLKPAMDDQKQLQANISQVSWQAFGEDNSKSADWIATEGKKQIKSLITDLVKTNGGTADAALNLINSMMANGMSFDEVKKNAKTSHQAMIVSAEAPGQYNPEETAKLMKVLHDFGFEGAGLSKAFEHAMKSGMQGNFEIADMVRELPALLPAAKANGMTGINGFDYLLSMLQSSSNKAGSNSEAANNIRNLLEKTLSADTTKRLQKMAHPTEKGKGIDWQGSVIKGAADGKNAVDVLTKLADQMLSQDKQYQELQLKSQKGDKNASNQMNIMKGFVLSSLLPDIQAKAGLNAAVDTKQINDYIQGLLNLDPKDDIVNKKANVLSRDDLFQQEKNKSEAMLGRGDITDPLNSVVTKWTELTAELPNTTLALTALAAAATAASGALGLMAVLGGKGKGGGFGRIFKRGAPSAVGGALKKGVSAAIGSTVKKGAPAVVGGVLKRGASATGGAIKGVSRVAGRADPWAAGGIGVYNAYDIEQQENLTREQKNTEQLKNAGSTVGGLGGAWGGAALGASIGSVVPVIGTAIGGILGAAIGGWLGSTGGEKLAEIATEGRSKYPQQNSAAASQAYYQRNPPALGGSQGQWQNPLIKSPAFGGADNKMQPLIFKQTADFQASMQGNTAALTGKLDLINSTLASQQQTIQNNISVTLDGRLVAEQVSRQQLLIFRRNS